MKTWRKILHDIIYRYLFGVNPDILSEINRLPQNQQFCEYRCTMNKDVTIRHIVERLGTAEINYHEKTVGQDGRHGKCLEAGVLIPIFFETGRSTDNGEFVFLLSKRSAAVPQSGDLSGPGGKLEPFLDRLLRFFIVRLCPSLLNGDALMYARKRGDAAFDNITLFLANAVRESWEEIRLSPFNVRFLGPLPPYSLRLFTKTIFPVVGLV